jgi:nicotinamidase-related amidase
LSHNPFGDSSAFDEAAFCHKSETTGSIEGAMCAFEAGDDLHGNVPEQAGAVLLLVDVINDLDFPHNEHLVKVATGLGRRILQLKRRCTRAGIPTIYVNDNKGRWRSDIRNVVSSSQCAGAPGRELVRILAPEPADYVVLKPKHSVFFATPLDLILQAAGAHTIIVAGLTTNACVLISAAEIYIRGLRLIVPRDCVEALSPESQKVALKILSESFHAHIQRSPSLKLRSLKSKRN